MTATVPCGERPQRTTAESDENLLRAFTVGFLLLLLLLLLLCWSTGPKNVFELCESLSRIEMERNLEKTLDDISSTDGIVGCLLADHAGLCLGAKGDASSDSAGIVAAIADQVAKLEPASTAPIISLQNDTRQCLIQRLGPVVGAIYKDMSI